MQSPTPSNTCAYVHKHIPGKSSCEVNPGPNMLIVYNTTLYLYCCIACLSICTFCAADCSIDNNQCVQDVQFYQLKVQL